MADSVQATVRLEFRSHALRLEQFTIGWTLLEALVGIALGFAAGSVALLGFGFDGVIECASACVLIWRLAAERSAHDPGSVERLDRLAHRLVAISLFGLSAYIIVEATLTLWHGDRPRATIVGIGLVVLTIGVMYWLALAKRRAAVALDSRALAADSFQATACIFLSLTTLAGIGLNARFGWWWADPVAALCMPFFLIQEGRKAWRGEGCC